MTSLCETTIACHEVNLMLHTETRAFFVNPHLGEVLRTQCD